jgi:hypothetical protein
MAEGAEHFVDEVGWQSIVHKGRWGCSKLLEERCGGDILRKRWKRGIRHDDASAFAVEAAISQCFKMRSLICAGDIAVTEGELATKML